MCQCDVASSAQVATVVHLFTMLIYHRLPEAVH